MIRAVLLAALALAGCGGGPRPAPPKPAMTNQLAIKLVTSGAEVAMADRATFEVGFEVTNRGAAPVAPELHLVTLAVNGEDSAAWSLAINNGGRDAMWFSLPPGKSIAMAWPLGEALFPAPGTYHLVMTAYGAQHAADVVVR